MYTEAKFLGSPRMTREELGEFMSQHFPEVEIIATRQTGQLWLMILEHKGAVDWKGIVEDVVPYVSELDELMVEMVKWGKKKKADLNKAVDSSGERVHAKLSLWAHQFQGEMETSNLWEATKKTAPLVPIGDMVTLRHLNYLEGMCFCVECCNRSMKRLRSIMCEDTPLDLLNEDDFRLITFLAQR